MINYSKSLAGKLGAEKSKLVATEKKNKCIAEYNLKANHCQQCNAALPYSRRSNKFCNSSCSATYNNYKRGKSSVLKKKNVTLSKENNKVTWRCLNCGTEHESVNWRVGKYCNVTCQHNALHKERINNWDVKVPGMGAIKKYLTETYGYKCACCGITEYNAKPITLEIEHKDGNSENNSKDNLCLLCPNCHSQTSTYKGRNKGKGRHSRRQRYKDNKSY